MIAHDAGEQELVDEARHGNVVVQRERLLLFVHLDIIQNPAKFSN